MLRNEKGFTLFEAIISLNILIIFCGLIVPSMTLLLQKKEQAQILKNAEDLLTDAVHLYYLDHEEFSVGDVFRNGKLFSIYLTNPTSTSLMLCVKWDERTKESEICEDISE